MKYRLNISVGLIALGFLSGCSVMERDLFEQTERVKLLALNDVGLFTKSIYPGIGTGADELDRIGVVVTAGNDFYNDEIPTQQFYYNGTGWEARKDTLFLAEKSGTVYACSVPKESATFTVSLEGGIPVLPGTIACEQSCRLPADLSAPLTDVDQYDYLYGTEPGNVTNRPVVSRDHNTASLEMRHFMAKVSFRVMKAIDQSAPGENDFIKSVTLQSTGSPRFTAGVVSFNLGNGKITGGSLYNTIKLSNVGDYAKVDAYTANHAGLGAKMFGLTAPVTKVEGTISVLLGQKANTRYDRSYQAENTVFSWEGGKHYIYSLLITDVGLIVSKPQVVGWEESAISEPVLPDSVTKNK